MGQWGNVILGQTHKIDNGNEQWPGKLIQRWNLKNLSRGLNPPKPGLNEAPA